MNRKSTFSRGRVARRVFVRFLFAAFVPVAATTLIVVNQAQDTLTEHSYTRLRSTSKAIGQSVYERLLFVDRSSEEIAARLRKQEITADTIQQLNSEYFLSMALVASSMEPAMAPDASSRLQSLKSAEQHLAESGALLAWSISGSETVALSMNRSIDPAKPELGMIVADVNIDYLWGDPETRLFDREYCVLESERVIVYCSATWARTIAAQIPPHDIESTQGFFDAHYDGEKFLASYWPIFLAPKYHSPSWTVVAIRAEANIMAPIVAFNALFGPVILLTVLLVLFLSVSQIRKIFVPLDKLIRGTRQIAQRKFGSSIEVTSGDEFQELAVSMNNMAHDLETQFETLQALSEIDRLILGRAEIEAVIESVLLRLRQVSNYTIASLTLVGHDSAARMFVGHAGCELTIERIMLSEQQLESYFAGPARVIDAQDRDDRLFRPLVNLGAQSIFVLPLASQGRFSAIICLGYRDNFAPPSSLVKQIVDFGDRITVALGATAHEEQLYHQAHYDPLTLLPNRQLFKDRLQQSIAHACLQNQKGALLYIDLDNFKVVNDSKGHTFGDELLNQVAGRLKSYVGDADTVARLGGDEFTVILSNISSPQRVGRIADELADLLSEPFNLDHRDQFISASIGIAIFPDDGSTIEELLKNADTAMYRAKANGRDTHTFFTNEMNEEVVNRHRLESDLRSAIENNQFFLEYQPQVDLKSRNIIGVEALVRWRHPDRGLISPAEFIPLAEDAGQIEAIGRWTLHTACEQFETWRSKGFAPERIAVNVSPIQITQSDFVATVRTVLAATDMQPHCLELEITENLLLDNTEQTLRTLKSLHTMGIRIAIDDFGTGYSSMSYLNRLSFDILKIDRSFVTDLGASEEANAIVHAIIALAKALRKEVVAEGIETAEHAAILARTHCQYGQGYLFSKPLSAGEFAMLIATQDKKMAS